ncbi:TlpA family protein disulfide reductase [Chitinophaga caseinilytica]|uniref:TlpA family protein disulfide reductase n=1 Tax=Chitinophaga caseinilytica TaxID=2267521 RepID=UPI003C2D826C
MGIAVVVLFVSPNAKSWTLRQLMRTGFFNASMEKEAPAAPAVDFAFEDGKGNLQHTSSLRGKVVFINFWASWCPPCRAEFPSIESLYGQFKNDPGIFFLTINEDDNASAAFNYLQKEQFTVPFYKASGRVPAEVYSGTLPTTVVLDKQGRIRFHHTGFANYGSEKFVQQVEALIREN